CAFVVYRSAVHQVTADFPNARLAVRGPAQGCTRPSSPEFSWTMAARRSDWPGEGQFREAKSVSRGDGQLRQATASTSMVGRPIGPDEKAHARSSLGTIVSTWRHALLRPTPSTARMLMYQEPAAKPLNV